MKLLRNGFLAVAVMAAALGAAGVLRAQDASPLPAQATPAVETVAPGAAEAHAAPAATAGGAPAHAAAEQGSAEGKTHEGGEKVGGEHEGAQEGEHEIVTGPFGHVCVGTGHCDYRTEAEPFNVIHHVSDGQELEFPLLPFLGHIHLPPWLSKVRVWMVLSSLVLILGFALARSGMGLVPKGLYNLLESFVLFVRDEIAIKNIGEHHGKAWTPYLLTVFFFILTCNFMGLLPGGVTVTGNINVTAALALMTLAMMQYGGIRQYGFVHHFKNLVPPGMPVWLLPIMIPVEIMGVFAKPFALAVRLFANMTAGHVIILSLLALIFQFGLAFSPVSIGFSLFIFLLELLVALLQAYIFTMLTALFIGMSVHVAH